MAADWIEQEPGLQAAGREIARVLRRARDRPWLTLLLAAAITAGLVYRQATKLPEYTASAVLRISESAYYYERSSMRADDLVDYVWNAIVNQPTILELIDTYELYPGMAARSADLAVIEFQDGFALDEYRNYFLASRDDGALRSARLMIEFAHTDLDKAEAVVRHVAQLVIDYETARRGELVEAALAAARAEVARARTVFEARRVEVLAKPAPLSTDVAALDQLETRLDASRSRFEEIELNAAAEVGNQSLRIEIADVHRPFVQARTPAFFAVLGAVVFSVFLLLSAVGVGAFDGAIRNRDDIARLGLPVVGHVPAFAGCRHGALRERLADRTTRQG